MPQMAPMNWLMLFMLFSSILTIVQIKITLMND